MKKSAPDAANLLQELLSAPIAQRIEAIADDVFAKKDRFRTIDPHDLAYAIGVPQPECPENSWTFTRRVEKISVEEYSEEMEPASEFVYMIEDKVSTERFLELLQHSSDLDSASHPSFDFLTSSERELLEEAIGIERLKHAGEVGMNCIARYSVKTASGHVLQFEADIEDDGSCIVLRTPYDFRDGEFDNLDNCWTDEF